MTLFELLFGWSIAVFMALVVWVVLVAVSE